MDFHTVIEKRRSIRKYKSDPIPKESLDRILHAAWLAPTWANMQGPKIVVVDEKEQIERLSKAIGQKWIKNIPLFLVVGISPNNSGTNAAGIQYYPVDAAIVMEHLILAAVDEGLGTCWIGWFDEEKVKAVLHAPEEIRIIGITPLGYPAADPNPLSRQPIQNLVYRNHF
jgi:nitroreductase